MERDFLKLKTDPKRLPLLILGCGAAVTVFMGILEYQNTALSDGYVLERANPGEDAYEEKLTAEIGQENIPVSVEVQARILTAKEARAELRKAKKLLNDLLKGENESLSRVTGDLNFADAVPGTLVEVEWTEKLSDYFLSDGTLREDVELLEPAQFKVSAVLSCQELAEDYEAVITLMPRKMGIEAALSQMIRESDEKSANRDQLMLPESYEGKGISWKRQPDYTFLSIPVLSLGAVVLLKAGKKRDEEQERSARLEELEHDYAGIVSKFAMLLAAGLSVRNAWERIVRLGCKDSSEKKAVYEEMKRTLGDMQKGIPELEAYEAFGNRVGQIHYKKLMALFVSHKKRGSIDLIDAMNREMLQAWEEQKRKTKQQGEKIGTKLLMPMMGMLAVVFVIILVPAFLSF